MVLIDYSHKSCVLYGEDTQIYKDKLKELGGKWNRNLSYNDNPIKGWIFPLKYKKSVKEFLKEFETKKNYCDVSIKSDFSIESTLRKEIQEVHIKLTQLSLMVKHQETQINMYISLFQMLKLDREHETHLIKKYNNGLHEKEKTNTKL